jgi:signal transduction histidine kinase/ActR/RegA family two-component response regulator
MSGPRFLTRLGDRLALTPIMAAVVAVALLATGLGLAVYNEHLGRVDRERQAATQAQILADSLAAPLAFDDKEAAAEYVNALRANPDIEAAAAYDGRGRLAAGFTSQGARPPARNVIRSAVIDHGAVVVATEVTQNGTRLGSVYLRESIEPVLRRAARYLGIGLLVIMAALLIAVLGAANASLSEAHRKLRLEVEEREKAEEALRQSQKMEAMGQLTGGVAHDFNNLLMAASSGLYLMEKTDDPDRQAALKLAIRQSIDRGARLTQQLLAFSRRTAVKPEVVDVGAVLRGMRELLDRSLREDIVVDLRPSQGLWPVEVDRSQFEVAVLNIALNARDAMASGGTIVISADNAPADGGQGDRVRLAITDTGPGIAPEIASRVFEPFFTTKDVGQGTGLGLSQVYGFARSSGGEARVESEPGRGATVALYLPRSTKPLPVAVAPPPPPPANALPKPSASYKVLVVEDDESVAGLVLEMVRELGYRACRAASADQALQTLGADPAVDLVFSDMLMPGDMNGLDLAHEVMRRRPDVPVVLTTGYSAAAASATEEGIRLLLKPYRIDALAAELQAALTGKHPA